MTTTKKIKIPATIDAASKRLADIDALLTARHWERSAIVWAYVQTSPVQGAHVSGDMTKETPAEFAARGIVGLRSRTTIMRYWKKWETLREVGQVDAVAPGDEVELPDIEWDDDAIEAVEETTLKRNVTKKLGHSDTNDDWPEDLPAEGTPELCEIRNDYAFKLGDVKPTRDWLYTTIRIIETETQYEMVEDLLRKAGKLLAKQRRILDQRKNA